MIKKKSLFIIVILILGFMMFFPSTITAISDPITDPNAYKPGSINTSDANVVAQKGGIIFNIISTLGIIVAVITIIVIGIKYMVGRKKQNTKKQ
jgi:hypothetical protein